MKWCIRVTKERGVGNRKDKVNDSRTQKMMFDNAFKFLKCLIDRRLGSQKCSTSEMCGRRNLRFRLVNSTEKLWVLAAKLELHLSSENCGTSWKKQIRKINVNIIREKKVKGNYLRWWEIDWKRGACLGSIKWRILLCILSRICRYKKKSNVDGE